MSRQRGRDVGGGDAGGSEDGHESRARGNDDMGALALPRYLRESRARGNDVDVSGRVAE